MKEDGTLVKNKKKMSDEDVKVKVEYIKEELPDSFPKIKMDTNGYKFEVKEIKQEYVEQEIKEDFETNIKTEKKEECTLGQTKRTLTDEDVKVEMNKEYIEEFPDLLPKIKMEMNGIYFVSPTRAKCVGLTKGPMASLAQARFYATKYGFEEPVYKDPRTKSFFHKNKQMRLDFLPESSTLRVWKRGFEQLFISKILACKIEALFKFPENLKLAPLQPHKQTLGIKKVIKREASSDEGYEGSTKLESATDRRIGIKKVIKREASSVEGYEGRAKVPKLETAGGSGNGINNGIKREDCLSDEGLEGSPKVPKLETASDIIHFTVNGEGFTEVHTDGVCSGNGRVNARAGVGVWWGKDNKLNACQPLARSKPTAELAGIQAATVAIKLAVNHGIKKLLINTDSQYVINCATLWLSNWKKGGWITKAKQPVKNREDLEELDDAMKKGEIQVKWNHVKSRAGHQGNEEAAKLAAKGACL